MDEQIMDDSINLELCVNVCADYIVFYPPDYTPIVFSDSALEELFFYPESLEDFCDQPELTRFMAMEVSTDDEDGTSMDDETATQLFVVSAAMIALLNRASQANS